MQLQGNEVTRLQGKIMQFFIQIGNSNESYCANTAGIQIKDHLCRRHPYHHQNVYM